MTENQLGQLEEVELRSIWSDEARDFTPWLADNLDLLGRAIGLDLEREDTEVPVGDFSLTYWLRQEILAGLRSRINSARPTIAISVN